RDYISGAELRVRCELGLPVDLQAVVMNRALQEQMEAEVFDQYVEGVQTRIDTETPPEMRWLVMFPKLGAAEMGALRERWVALASYKPWIVQWLEGPFAAALEASTVAPETPLVLMIARGRLTLRTALAEPDVRVLTHAIALFETAAHEAQRVGDMRLADLGAPHSSPSLWGASDLPSTPGDDPK
ncbi:MAG: hypothetical protein KGM91_26310, partial [Burkholderiales bacterium]|nr:hypothetical protein [Burkholderiales bacterium]